MARKKVARRVLWSKSDVKSLRSLAGKKSLIQVARALKRSPAAVAFKAHMEKISLRQKSA